MSKQESSELLETLAELRRRYPAWRFGQLIENIAGWADQDVWDVSDDALLEAARAHIEVATKREEEVCV